jgi:hypothetical protein
MQGFSRSISHVIKSVATPFEYKKINDYSNVTKVENSMKANGKMRYNLCLLCYLIFDLVFVKDLTSDKNEITQYLIILLASNTIFLTILQYQNDLLHILVNFIFCVDRFIHVYVHKDNRLVFPV